MILRWFGHAFFLLESAGGTRIAADPHDPPIGYDDPHIKPQFVTISHDHHDHAFVERTPGAKVIDHKTGSVVVGDVAVEAFPSFHDEERGAQRGPNTMYVFSIDGLRIAHLGDLGERLSEAQVAQIGPVDVLLLPVGGYYTIDAAQAAELAERMSATVVVPMHYKTPRLTFELDTILPFLALCKSPVVRAGRTVELTKEYLTRCTLVMNYE